MISARDNVRKIHDISDGLGYLFVVYLHVGAVKPKTGKGFSSRRAFRLRYLVVVMYRYVLNSAGMNINLFSQNRARHSRTFNVPPWKTLSPRAVPTEYVSAGGGFVFGGEFPQSKIGLIVFVFVGGNPRALTLFFRMYSAQGAVGRKANGVKIDAIWRQIRESFFHERGHHRNLCRNMSAGSREGDFFGVDIQLPQVLQEYLCVSLSKFKHVLER